MNEQTGSSDDVESQVPLVVGFAHAGANDLKLVGGKGANLAVLTSLGDVGVPAGFVVTTRAFDRVVGSDPVVAALLDEFAASSAGPVDDDGLATSAAELRRTIESLAIPKELAAEIAGALTSVGGVGAAWAVRSSATAEDLPSASFAGQHDSFLQLVGEAEVVAGIRRCWASLFTDRAVAYRRNNSVDPHSVSMAVVIQQMVGAEASGVMFTADPLTSDRTVVAIEACLGLGEALVSGRVTPDVFRVRRGSIVESTIAVKDLVVRPVNGGGTSEFSVEPVRGSAPSLTDAQVLRLAELGRRVESHFGTPQDIEWCLAGADFWVVQSRPITRLFPIPPADDDANHVYVSVGHGQMMTDAMKPLGLSFWQMTTPAPVREAGGRLFVDVTSRLADPAARGALLDVFGKSDPLLRDALETVISREDFFPVVEVDTPTGPPSKPPSATAAAAPQSEMIDADPVIVAELIEQSRASVLATTTAIKSLTGTELVDFIKEDMQELRRVLFDPRSHQVFMTAMDASWWLNEHLLEWLGEPNVADTLTQSVPNNVTSEMGLALLDVADAIRPHPDVVEYLRGATDAGFLAGLGRLAGGAEARSAIEGFLASYGMRCPGEIDITRPRWSERPDELLPLILSHVETMEPGEAERRFTQGEQEALAKKAEVLERLAALPDGVPRSVETEQMIDRVRTFMGYREYPKYAMVSRYFIYKLALSGEADRLVAAGVLGDRDDIYFLRFDELHEVVRTGRVDADLIRSRREDFAAFERLSPPRVLTSDGEALSGSYIRSDVPDGALPGLAVSTGVVEGRARVVSDIAVADLEQGDILVTPYTDPSWTPIFVSIAGLVTEVGGMMTHGAVIAREYGLPAVVGVQGATVLIRNGQMIRVDGTQGHVTIL